MTPEDIPSLFLQKGKLLKELLCANDYQGLASIEGNILELANTAPNRFNIYNNGHRSVKDKYSERQYRDINLARIGVVAVADALIADAFDAVEWAVGPTGFGYEVSLKRVLSNNGFQVIQQLPLSTLAELNKRGLMTPDLFPLGEHYGSWDLPRVVKDRYNESEAEFIQWLPYLPDISQELASYFRLNTAMIRIVYESHNEFDSEKFVRWCIESHIIHNLCYGGVEADFRYEWATEYVDEFTYWIIMCDTMTNLIDNIENLPTSRLVKCMGKYRGTEEDKRYVLIQFNRNCILPKCQELLSLANKILKPYPKNAVVAR